MRPPPREGWQEVLGFFCRWCLLALAGAAVVAVGRAGAQATQGLVGDLTAGMVLPDIVGRVGEDGRRPNFTGYMTPQALDASAGTPALFLSFQPTAHCLVSQDADRIYPQVYDLHAGINRVRVEGVPYGAFAFFRTWGECLGAAAGQNVILVDARAVLTGLQSPPNELAQCLRRLEEMGAVALFHPGPREAFVRDRQDLRSRGVQRPIVCSLPANSQPMYSLWHAAAMLGGPSVVVTADPDIAHAAATDSGARFRVHLIGPASGSDKLPRLHRHASWAKFKEYLAARPIAE